MLRRHAQPGRITWIGLRPERRAPMRVTDRCDVDANGLVGDRAKAGKRAVTLIQQEHLAAIGAYLGRDSVSPEDLRRNIVVTGINLAALKGRSIVMGDTVLSVEGLCAPCSRMEETFGPGGYSAVRGHGGSYCSVETPGRIALCDQVTATAEPEEGV